MKRLMKAPNRKPQRWSTASDRARSQAPVKKTRFRLGVWEIALAILVSLLIYFVGIPEVTAWNKKAAEQRDTQAMRDIKSAFRQYDLKRGQTTDTWWLENSPPINKETYDLFTARLQQIVDILDEYKDTSPETARIAERFREFRPGLYVNGVSMIMHGPAGADSYPPGVLTVTFLTAEDVKRENTSSMPLFSSGYDMLAIPGIEIPKPVYAAILFHELGHALRHNRFDGNPVVLNDDLYMEEEVEMHELGRTVLNRTSNGNYDKLVKKIVARSKSHSDFKQVVAKITVNDLIELDAMFGCTQLDVPNLLITTQLALDVGFESCNIGGQGMPGKVAVYKWFTSGLFDLV